MIKKLSYGIFIIVLSVTHMSGTVIGLSATQEDLLRKQCPLSRTQLQKVWRNDGLVRANLGQRYENIYQKLMSPFNRRAIAMNLDTDQILAITEEYNSTLTRFRDDYLAYHQTLNAAIKVQCNGSMAQYYDLISQARKLRTLTNSTTEDMKNILNQYRGAVDIVKRQAMERTK